MFWDIFLLAFGILMILAFISNWRDSQKNDPISDELKFLIENTLIPLKKEIQEEYNPDAIVFAKVNEADPMPDLKDKDNISACAFIVNKTLYLRSIQNPKLCLEIPFGEIKYMIKYNKKWIYDITGYPFAFRLKKEGPKDIMFSAIRYRYWRDQEYKDVLDPQPFINILTENLTLK